MNKCFYIGKAISDPALASIPDGTHVCRFKIAVENVIAKPLRYDYFDVVAWRSLADKAEQRVRENDLVFVSGMTQIRKVKQGDEIKVIVEVVAAQIEVMRGGGNDPHIDYSSEVTPLEQLANKKY